MTTGETGVQTALRRITVLAHPLRENTFPVAERIARSLSNRDIQVRLFTTWREDEVHDDVKDTDMVVTIGGDGAMLRSARVCSAYDVPVLGVNMGQLGFLTEVRMQDEWDAHLDRLFAGDYWIETRMMIAGYRIRDGQSTKLGDALNDIVISGNTFGRMISLHAFIDSEWATSYHADALVIATPTGSTAYALACGGPILPPELENLLVVPAAPHLSMDRPIVLSEGAKVEVEMAAENRGEVIISADGVILGTVEDGDRICVKASDYCSRFVRMRGRNYFYRALLDRMEPRVRQRPQDLDKREDLNDSGN